MRTIWPTKAHASAKSTQKKMFCRCDQKTGNRVISARTPNMGMNEPVAKIKIRAVAAPFANRSYLGCLVSTPMYSLAEAMTRMPAMNAAAYMCDCQITPITTSRPIPGMSRLPTGTLSLPLSWRPAGEVGDPEDREDHVEHHRRYDQKGHYGHERPRQRAVSRLLIQPRDREQQNEEQGRYHDPPEGYERETGEEHEHLVVEHEEPLGSGHVARGADVHRLRQGRGHQVRQHDDDRQKNGRTGEVD